MKETCVPRVVGYTHAHTHTHTHTQRSQEVCALRTFSGDLTGPHLTKCTRCNHVTVRFRDNSTLFKLDDLVTVIRSHKLRLINVVINVY